MALTKEEKNSLKADGILDAYEAGKNANLTIAHGKHRPDTGWAQFGHPGPEDEGSPHKQFDPGGDPLYNPLDGGDIVPWDQRPLTISSMRDSYRREQIGETPRDIEVPKLIEKYGPGKNGEYKNPDMLIKGLLELV